MAGPARSSARTAALTEDAGPTAALYPALCEELSALAKVAEGLQAATGALVEALGPAAATLNAHRYELQNLDLLTQRLQALAVFFDAMPDLERAVGAVTLSDLARRIRGDNAAQPKADEATGEFELF
jgi:hypothetical protein